MKNPQFSNVIVILITHVTLPKGAGHTHYSNLLSITNNIYIIITKTWLRFILKSYCNEIVVRTRCFMIIMFGAPYYLCLDMVGTYLQ